MKRRKTLALLAAGTGVALALTACGANSSSGGSGSGDQGGSSNGGPKVGVILPETATSARWAGFDQPMLQAALTKAGLSPIIENAQGDNQKFSQYADSMLSQGVKALIIAAPSGDVGATVEQKAAQQGVPVIDYDRLNLGGSANYYVSFDNTKVGELQGQALADALKGKQGAQVIEIEGSPTDNNATLFHNGQENIVGPLYTSGALKKVASQAIDGWDNQKGGQTFEQLLSANGGKVDGVLAANDGLAGAIITVLQKNGLAGKVPVTGQDASAAGLTAILAGTQYSTVFKPIQQEADAAAQLAAALVKGDTASADKIATASSSDPKNNRTVKSVLLQPQTITKQNVKLVVDQGYVKASEVCTAEVAAACTQLGIS
ncbi:D-xylose transport system substrate-binding protein [Amycolatopsis bartoniae]|uniref:Sugar ABC transporter substrate-binding protein n=1 Tax=Amycolatopsis bartoniae TaxID=941986 RepID=A0A8H9IR07_9PSEU|nr:substrate-binding domain-containing protein [Amycolatopsis bartoniae]MBB2939550.1 D-xylose transport system substrate-binding protein [Amycolatopsis bartoniae]TVT00029.1 sugar ABC transporter substrate-binding protein [Amycolatopsis bartoniae]GHF39120.1 sugar ABC transporter substrate-binding protein [Amycolatopsis bartoniae]